MRYRSIIWPTLLLLGLGGGVYFGWFGPAEKSAGKPAGKETPPVPVNVARVQIKDVIHWLDVVGRGQASATVTLKARIDGQVSSVPFTEGQHVRQGDLLVRLDPADYQARLKLAEANLARSQAQLAKARADVDRYIALRQSGFVSEEKVAELRAILQAAEAATRADQAAIDLAGLQLGYTAIRAPIDGIIGAKQVFPGAGVKNNDTALAVINRVRPLHVAFAVPERHLPRIRAAMAEGGVVARIGSDKDKIAHGKIEFIDNAVDSSTGTIQLKAIVDNADQGLAPGQFVTVRLALDTWKQAATLPAEAIQQSPQGSFVFVIKADQGIEQRKVVLVDSRDGVAVVTQGLADGETVVTDGHLRLTPKSKVKVIAKSGNK